MSINNYLPATDASIDQRRAHANLMAALRQLNEQTILLNTDATTLQQWTTEIEELTLRLQSHQGDRLLEYYLQALGPGVSNGMQPYSPLGGLSTLR